MDLKLKSTQKSPEQEDMIRCNMCGKKDYHYTERRDTSIGCYQFSYPLERKYVCDRCITSYIDFLKNIKRKRTWWPFEIRA
jgi:hypothetical protein